MTTKILAYPNPSAGSNALNLQFGTVIKAGNASLMDAQGRIMIQAAIVNKKESSIDVTLLPAGFYIVVVSDGSRSFGVKWIR